MPGRPYRRDACRWRQSRVAELGDERPILVASRDVTGFVEGPQGLREQTVVEVELVIDDRPFVRLDVGNLVQCDRVGAVTAGIAARVPPAPR